MLSSGQHLKHLVTELSKAVVESLATGLQTMPLMLCTQDGTVVYANSIARGGFQQFTSKPIIGQSLCDMAPKNWALERVGCLKHAVDRERPIHLFEITAGNRCCTTISPIVLDQEMLPDPLLLVSVEIITPKQLKRIRETHESDDLVDAKIIDLGPLSGLTPREIEILAMMGQGMRQKEIAGALHRSVSTIDRHRERIGVKLGVKDRADLIVMARRAALEVSTAQCINANFRRARLSAKS